MTASTNDSGAGAVLRPAITMKERLGRNVRHVRRNYRLGIVEGAFGGAANDLLHPELILAGFVYAVTGSAVAVALVTVVHKCGVLTPQFVVGNMVEPFSRRRPFYTVAAVVRLTSVLGIAASMFLLERFAGPVGIALFYGAVFFHALSKGVLNLLRSDMIGRLIPQHRVGSLLGVRKFLGGVMAILAGAVVIQPILSMLHLPYNYLTVMGVALVVAMVESGSWCSCKEKPGRSSETRKSLVGALRRGVKWLKTDWDYWCYLWIRVSFRFSYVGMAFFIPYGSEALGYRLEAGGLAVLGGVLVAVRKVSDLLASLVWARIADARGYRATLVGASIVTVMAPVMAIVAGHLPSLFELNIPGIDYPFTFPLLIFLLALACIGAGFSGLGLAGQQFLIVNAPPEHRPSYLAFINTLIAPLTFLPIAGAALVGVLGMNFLFILVAAGASLGVFGAIRMQDPRTAQVQAGD